MILCHSRRQLRQITKKVYSIMKSLNIEIHPDKTWLVRVKNGFDFLGFRITPTSIHPSTTSVSRRDEKIARLYEQGANRRRIGQYLRRWSGWSVIACCAMSTANGAPGLAYTAAQCSVNQPVSILDINYENTQNGITSPEQIFFIDGIGVIPFVVSTSSLYDFATFSTTPPTTTSITPSSSGDVTPEPTSTAVSQTIYASFGAGENGEVCTIQYDLQGVGGALTRTNAAIYTRLAPTVPDPMAVPIFTPLGLIATISGLLWFGRRRTIKVKNT